MLPLADVTPTVFLAPIDPDALDMLDWFVAAKFVFPDVEAPGFYFRHIT